MRELYGIAVFLLVLGGFILGAIGLFDYDILAVLFGKNSLMYRSLYSLGAIASLYVVIDFFLSGHKHMHTPLRT